MKNNEIYSEIDTAIANNSTIVFVSYSMLDETDDKIRYTLEKILNKFNREEWITPVFSAVKELISNGLKANAKKILIDEGIIKPDDSISEVVRKLRTILNERAVLEYGIKKKAKSLSTRIYLEVSGEVLTIKVINNLPLNDRELQKIHDRINISAKYDNIAEFFMDYPDPAAEGMGLGLCMVLTLLKSIDIDCDNFTFTTDGIEKTCAQMTIPFN